MPRWCALDPLAITHLNVPSSSAPRRPADRARPRRERDGKAFRFLGARLPFNLLLIHRRHPVLSSTRPGRPWHVSIYRRRPIDTNGPRLLRALRTSPPYSASPFTAFLQLDHIHRRRWHYRSSPTPSLPAQISFPSYSNLFPTRHTLNLSLSAYSASEPSRFVAFQLFEYVLFLRYLTRAWLVVSI